MDRGTIFTAQLASETGHGATAYGTRRACHYLVGYLSPYSLEYLSYVQAGFFFRFILTSSHKRPELFVSTPYLHYHILMAKRFVRIICAIWIIDWTHSSSPSPTYPVWQNSTDCANVICYTRRVIVAGVSAVVAIGRHAGLPICLRGCELLNPEMPVCTAGHFNDILHKPPRM